MKMRLQGGFSVRRRRFGTREGLVNVCGMVDVGAKVWKSLGAGKVEVGRLLKARCSTARLAFLEKGS